MPKSSKESAIPLICILCPGNKHFSDLSHLLTHLNSKGHLQQKHKLELRCGNEDKAKETLIRFAEWYNDNNFAELLSDRLQPKDKKKTGTSKTGKPVKGIKLKRTSSAVGFMLAISYWSWIDHPQTIKPETESGHETAMSQVNSFRAPEPQMNPLLKRSDSDKDGWMATMYGTPTASRSIPNFTREDEGQKTPVDPA